MGTIRQKALAGAVALAVATGFVAGCAQMSQMMGGGKDESAGRAEQVTLSGRNEVPSVDTGASGTATVTVSPDRTVTARVSVTGMTATAAHIHQGARGANGPVIVPFTKSGDNTFVAPAGAKMTDEQFAAYKAGNTYVNVHSAKNPGGEIRGQLRGS